MKKKHKRPLTLLELMIGLSLAAILIAFLFQFYISLSRSRIDLGKTKEEVFGLQRIQLRLNEVFKAASEPFYLEQGFLVFEFDNGIDRDPNFCGKVTGMLYIDEKQQLSFVTWSKLKEARKEVLATDVADYTLSFFDHHKTKSWISQWKKDLPAMTKLVVNSQAFIFYLPGQIETIQYDKIP